MKGAFKRLAAVALLAFACSGCITAAILGIVAVGCLAGVASSSNSCWSWCVVDSGVVGGNAVLKHRYSIVGARVLNGSPEPYQCAQLLSHWVSADKLGECVAEISALYPQVFVDSADAIPIIVELRLNAVGADRQQPDFDVKAIDARTGNVLGDDGFAISTVCQKAKPTPVSAAQGIIQVNTLEDAHHRLMALGYAGAIVSALSKSENGGKRSSIEGEPPSYVKPVVANGATAVQTSDNTAQAIGVLMGTKNMVDAMNQSQRSRTAPVSGAVALPVMPMETGLPAPAGTGVPATSGTSAAGSSGGDRYKRVCQIHGEIYDIRYGSGCQWCKQPDFGSGKTATYTCTVHGYKYDPKYGCPACQRMRNGSK